MKFPRLWSGLALVVVAAPIASCGGGGGGDVSYAPPPTPLAYYNNPANPRPSETDYIEVSNIIITAVDEYDETATGSAGNLFVQDMGADAQPYSGITVYNPGFIPPDLRVFTGDVVDIRSPYQEFIGPSSSPFNPGETLPELSGATVKFRFEAPALPTAKLIAPDELYDYGPGRQWMGVLVEMRNVVLQTDLESDSHNRWTAQLKLNDMAGRNPGKLPKVSNALYPLQTDTRLNMKAGSTFTIRGIVQYFFSFSITPRSPDDIQPGS
jgi:hypothetical protein